MKDLGFKCGIEIHQQLDTNKLFCNCPSLVNDPGEPDIEFTRYLRAVAGETGKVDKAAAHEQKKDLFFKYQACSSSSCLVELDEEPPHEVNEKALHTALQIAHLLNCQTVDEVQFMRKTVVDGSNVSGFQRTALIGFNGYVETDKGRVQIDNVCLEEEAAKKIKTEKDHIVYRLDRLGVPLIEIGTDASIKDPEHAKEVAGKIGMILRSTGKVKRGIGSIRQDVNVSIKGHKRVEIKGFQDLKSMPKTIENEIKRQQKSDNKEAHVRKANQDSTTSFLRPMPGAARMYPETDVRPIKVQNITFDRVELIDDKVKKFEELGLSKDLATNLAKSDKDVWFYEFKEKYENVKPAFIAATLVETPVELLRKHKADIAKLKKEHFQQVLQYLDQGKISKGVITEIFLKIIQGSFNIKDYEQASDDDLEREIKAIVESKPGLNLGAYMGLVMGKFKGKIDGKKAMDILKKYV